MANKTIYPYGVGGETPSGIDIVDDLTTGGRDKALSAEQGKELAQYVFMGSGTFAEAYDAAKTTLAYFPWLLEDTDKDGNAVKKMMWHVGNREFIDAIGAKIDGVKNGVTVVSTEAGYMRLWKSQRFWDASDCVDFPIVEGETNYSFEDLGMSSCCLIEFTNVEKTAFLYTKIKSIDFGGLVLKNSTYSDGDSVHAGISGRYTPFTNYSGLVSVKRLVVDSTIANPQTIGWFSGCSNLENIQMSGEFKLNSGGGNTISTILQGTYKLREVDFSGLTLAAKGYSDWFAGSSKLEYLDIRGFDFSNATSIARFVRGAALKTIIVGNIDTTKVTNSSEFMSNVTGATLVCTQDTPPAWNIDFVNGHISSIKVPNKTVDVDGTETAVIDLYKAANGWSTYADIMSTYEEGEY